MQLSVIERLLEIATAFNTDFTGLLEKIGKGEIEVIPQAGAAMGNDGR